MKKTTLTLTLLATSLVLAGCVGGKSPATSTPPSGVTTDSAGTAADQKVGDTTKSGTISEAGGRFYLNVTGQQPLEIDSYALDLSQYVGQTVTITGQYSGDTLFVGSIK